MPILTSAAYPIYDDNVASELPELLTRESSPAKNVVKEELSEKASVRSRDGKTPKEGKQGQKDRSSFRDQKAIKSKDKPTAASEKNPSAISKRDPVTRNSATPSSPSRSKLRQNPNRPRVIQREEQKEPQNLSKIEADADEVENGLSTHQNEERRNQEKSSSESVTAQETDAIGKNPEEVSDKSSRANPSSAKKQQGSYSRKHSAEE